MGRWRDIWLGKRPEREHERAGELTLGEVLHGGYPHTPSGVAVTPATALGLSAVWGCIRLLADTVSTLPVDTYRAGSREPMDKLAILVKPAAGMDFGEWVWCLLFEALTSPAAWCLVTDRTGPGLRPSQLEPLGRGRVTVTNEPDSDGRVRTVHRLDGRTIDADDLWRFRLYPAAGTPAGLGPIGYAAETIGQALAAQRYGATFFADSAIPSMALPSDQNISSAQAHEAKAMWEHAQRPPRHRRAGCWPEAHGANGAARSQHVPRNATLRPAVSRPLLRRAAGDDRLRLRQPEDVRLAGDAQPGLPDLRPSARRSPGLIPR